MKNNEIVRALRRLKVETGSLVCMGCGLEHDCGILGCRIVREAAELIARFPAADLRRWCMDALSDRLRMGATAEGFPAAERTLQ